jgi:hypothetical protein
LLLPSIGECCMHWANTTGSQASFRVPLEFICGYRGEKQGVMLSYNASIT